MELTLNSPKLRRQYVWMKSGGRCWYCGARLYSPGKANTEVKKQLIFTADHVHPRSRGGRGRANKVPACKYCNSHKSSRSVEEFREWLQARVFDKAKHPRAPAGEHVTRHWKINAEAVVFYFELARGAAARQTSASEIGWVAEQRPTWVEPCRAPSHRRDAFLVEMLNPGIRAIERS
jgi:hypothetical protein